MSSGNVEYAVRPYTRSGQSDFRPYLDIVTFLAVFAVQLYTQNGQYEFRPHLDIVTFARCLQYAVHSEWAV